MNAGQIAQVTLIVLASLIVVQVLAALRHWVMSTINFVFGLPAVPFGLALAALQLANSAAAYLLPRLQQALVEHSEEHETEASLSDIVGPLVYLAFFVVLTAGDSLLALIRFPLVFHVPPLHLESDRLVIVFMVLWVVTAGAFVAIAMDLFGMTRFARPYRNRTGLLGHWLRILCLASLALLLLTTLLFGIFTELALQFVSSSVLEGMLGVVLFVLITLASAATSWALFLGNLALLYVAMQIVRVSSVALSFVPSIPITMLDKAASLISGLYDIPAGFGRSLWNWLCRLPLGVSLQLRGIDEFSPRPHILEQLRLPAALALADSAGQ